MTHRSSWRGRLTAVAAIAVVAIGGLCACSGAGSSTADGKATVNWWSWDPDDAQSKQWIAAFEKEHPSVTVKYRFIQYSDYANAVRLAATSNSGPDVFGLQVGALTTQFAPLTVDLAPLAEKKIGKDWKDQLLGTQQLTAGGKQVGLPWMINGAGLVWYNKNILDQAGVKPPTTLAEWKDDCAKITALGKACFAQGAKDDWVNIDVYQSIANQITPGTFYKAVAGKAKFDSADFVKAFSVWKQLFDDGIVQQGALGQTQYPDVNDMFGKGQVAMIAMGTWNNDHMTTQTLANLVPTYGQQITSQVFVPIAFPDVVGVAKETGRLFGGPDEGWAISAKSKVKDAAFTLVQWLTSSKTAQTMMAKTLQTPALKSISPETSDLTAPQVQKPALGEQTKQINNLIGARQIQDADVQTALGQALSSVASGQMAPSDAARSVQKAIDAIKK